MTVSVQGMVEKELVSKRSDALRTALEELGWGAPDLALHLAERRGESAQAGSIQSQLEACIQGTGPLPIDLCADIGEQFDRPVEWLAVVVTDEERAALDARESDAKDDGPPPGDPLPPKGAGGKGGGAGDEIPLKVLRGRALEAALEASGMTQSELCRKACKDGTRENFRRLQCAVSNYRHSRNLMPEEIIGLLAPVLGVSEDTLRVRPADERESRAGKLRPRKKKAPVPKEKRGGRKPSVDRRKRPYHRRASKEAPAEPSRTPRRKEGVQIALDHAKFLELFGNNGKVVVSLKRQKGGVALLASVTLTADEFVTALDIPE